MPELPEVEAAARVLARAALGKRIQRVALLHPALRRRVDERAIEALRGRRIERVDRRGKHQMIALDDGTVVHVHFRMTGDWLVDHVGGPQVSHARAVVELADGTRIVLVDPRALATLLVVPPGTSARVPVLGPEATDPALTASALADMLRTRRLSIKQALLDQRVVAGLGNIYAAEALWRARIDPAAPAFTLSRPQLRRLLDAMRRVLDDAFEGPGRYGRGEAAERFRVYGRAGQPCERCRAPILRRVQGGRSTYYCARCQRG